MRIAVCFWVAMLCLMRGQPFNQRKRQREEHQNRSAGLAKIAENNELILLLQWYMVSSRPLA